jgi:hypothetical protein
LSIKAEALPGLVSRVGDFYKNMHNNMKEIDQFLIRNWKSGMQLPKGVDVYRSSTAVSIVDMLSEQIRTDEPLVAFNETGTSERARSHKSKMEMWGNRVLREATKHSTINFSEQAKWDMVARGAAAWRWNINLGALPDPDEFKSKAEWRRERARIWPYMVRPVDPINVMLAPGTARPSPYVIETQERTAQDMWLQYPDWLDPATGTDRTPDRVVKWAEYWSLPVYRDGKLVEQGQYIAMADNVPVFERVNLYGLLPYVFAYGGMGRVNFDNDPGRLAKSFLSDIVGELEAETEMKTIMSMQSKFHVLPRLLTQRNAEVARQQYMVGPGAIIEVDDMNSKDEWLASPPPNPQIERFLSQITESIFRRVPPALFQRPSGVDAGVHQALLIGQAKTILRPVELALNSMGSELLNSLAQATAHLDLDVNTSGNTQKYEASRNVNAKDFKNFNFDVKFEAIDQAENDRRLLVGLSAARTPGFISRQSIRENFAKGVIKDNEEEEAQILAEQLLDQALQSGALLPFMLEEMKAQQEGVQEEGVAGELRQRATQAAGEVAGRRERNLEGIAQSPGATITGTEEEQV